MENHPIPQDITGFQFKLVGKMTVKQFIYVGAGLLLAWLIYFVLKFPFILSFPLALFFSLGGLALAFLPIDGRPLDVMIANFLKAVFVPTQYVYEKQSGTGIPAPLPTINQTQPIQTPPAQESEAQINIVNPQPPISKDQTVTVPVSQPTPAIVPPHTENPIPLPVQEKQVEEKEQKVETEEQNLEQQISTAQSQNQNTPELQAKLDEILKQKEELEKELIELKNQLSSQQPAVPSVPISNPTPAPTVSPQQQPPIPPGQYATPTPPRPPVDVPGTLDEEPNLIKGTVRDPRGNPIQNILVEVKDDEDNPVRAFKTNNLGEFASATSLANGHYTIFLEDPKLVHKFDTVSINTTGAPITALEVTSIDPREELRRELFN